MNSLIEKGLNAKRESKSVEFKDRFDPTSNGDWCEIIKDIVALANSGGGIILFGLDSLGGATASDVSSISSLDPADFSNKITKYTGINDVEVELHELKKRGNPIIGLLIFPAFYPVAFSKAGTYVDPNGKEKMAFAMGTVYFRHGSKSEPGTSQDLRSVLDRQVHYIKKTWTKGLRQVVEAPTGSHILAVPPHKTVADRTSSTGIFKSVSDSQAFPVHLTRDVSQSSGILLHEQISDGIFEEINNVIDANTKLSHGKNSFLLGEPVYYRIYAEREHVKQPKEVIFTLLDTGFHEFYAPFYYWINQLPEELVAQILAKIYLSPKHPNTHHFIRASILMGRDFSKWVFHNWEEQWKNNPQPPSFFWAFKDMIRQLEEKKPLEVASRMALSFKLVISDNEITSAGELMFNPQKCAAVLSKTCMEIFNGNKDLKWLARDIDLLLYHKVLQDKTETITSTFKNIVRNKKSKLTDSEVAEVD